MPEQLAAIAMGSNLGDRFGVLLSALRDLGRLPGTRLVRWSSFRETDPVGPIAQGKFINACAVLSTTLPPRELLTHLLARDTPPSSRIR